MLIKYKDRHSLIFRAIAIAIVCLFIVNDIVWAQDSLSSVIAKPCTTRFARVQGEAISKLAAQSRLKPFSDKYGLDFQNTVTAAYIARELKDLVMVNKLRESHITRFNKRFLEGEVKIDTEIKTGILQCSKREYKYAVFHFKKEKTTIHALFIDKLTDEELKELRIKDEEKYRLDCPGLEGVWFINPDGAIAIGDGPKSATPPDSSVAPKENMDGPRANLKHVPESALQQPAAQIATTEQRKSALTDPGSQAESPMLNSKDLTRLASRYNKYDPIVAALLYGLIVLNDFAQPRYTKQLAMAQVFIFIRSLGITPVYETLGEKALEGIVREWEEHVYQKIIQGDLNNPEAIKTLIQEFRDGNILSLSKIHPSQIRGRTFVVRVDFNDVHFDESDKVIDDIRLNAAKETLQFIHNNGGKLVLITHSGRPNGFDTSLQLDQVAEAVSKLLGGLKVCKLNGDFEPDSKTYDIITKNVLRDVMAMKEGEAVLLENIRFDSREKSEKIGDRENLAVAVSRLGDIFVLDGFPISHREDTTVIEISKTMPSVAGFWLERELEEHKQFLKIVKDKTRKPLAAIFGGAKSDKIPLIKKFVEQLKAGDKLLFAGKLCDAIKTDAAFLAHLHKRDIKIVFSVDDINGKDIGKETIDGFKQAISSVEYVYWNGPLGKFEEKPYEQGSFVLARYVLELIYKRQIKKAFTSGGETAFVIKSALGLTEESRFQIKELYISTGGGTSTDFFAFEKNIGYDSLWGVSQSFSSSIPVRNNGYGSRASLKHVHELPATPDTKKPKGSCADFLDSIIGDDKLLEKALTEGLDIEKDIKPARLKLKNPDQPFSDTTILYREINALIDIGILTPASEGKVKFSDMMTKPGNKGPPDKEYTKSLIRQVIEIEYPIGKKGKAKNKPFHRGEIPQEIRPALKELVTEVASSAESAALPYTPGSGVAPKGPSPEPPIDDGENFLPILTKDLVGEIKSQTIQGEDGAGEFEIEIKSYSNIPDKAAVTIDYETYATRSFGNQGEKDDDYGNIGNSLELVMDLIRKHDFLRKTDDSGRSADAYHFRVKIDLENPFHYQEEELPPQKYRKAKHILLTINNIRDILTMLQIEKKIKGLETQEVSQEEYEMLDRKSQNLIISKLRDGKFNVYRRYFPFDSDHIPLSIKLNVMVVLAIGELIKEERLPKEIKIIKTREAQSILGEGVLARIDELGYLLSPFESFSSLDKKKIIDVMIRNLLLVKKLKETHSRFPQGHSCDLNIFNLPEFHPRFKRIEVENGDPWYTYVFRQFPFDNIEISDEGMLKGKIFFTVPAPMDSYLLELKYALSHYLTTAEEGKGEFNIGQGKWYSGRDSMGSDIQYEDYKEAIKEPEYDDSAWREIFERVKDEVGGTNIEIDLDILNLVLNRIDPDVERKAMFTVDYEGSDSQALDIGIGMDLYAPFIRWPSNADLSEYKRTMFLYDLVISRERKRWFNLLGLTEGVTSKEITKAWSKKIFELRPDLYRKSLDVQHFMGILEAKARLMTDKIDESQFEILKFLGCPEDYFKILSLPYIVALPVIGYADFDETITTRDTVLTWAEMIKEEKAYENADNSQANPGPKLPPSAAPITTTEEKDPALTDPGSQAESAPGVTFVKNPEAVLEPQTKERKNGDVQGDTLDSDHSASPVEEKGIQKSEPELNFVDELYNKLRALETRDAQVKWLRSKFGVTSLESFNQLQEEDLLVVLPAEETIRDGPESATPPDIEETNPALTGPGSQAEQASDRGSSVFQGESSSKDRSGVSSSVEREERKTEPSPISPIKATSSSGIIFVDTHDKVLDIIGQDEIVINFDFHYDRGDWRTHEHIKAKKSFFRTESNWATKGEITGQIKLYFLVHPVWQIEQVPRRFIGGIRVITVRNLSDELPAIDKPVTASICFDYFLHKGTPAIDFDNTRLIIGRRVDIPEDILLQEARQIFMALKAKRIKIKSIIASESKNYCPEESIPVIKRVLNKAWAEEMRDEDVVSSPSKEDNGDGSIKDAVSDKAPSSLGANPAAGRQVELILNSKGQTFDQVWEDLKKKGELYPEYFTDPREWPIDVQEEQFAKEYAQMSIKELETIGDGPESATPPDSGAAAIATVKETDPTPAKKSVEDEMLQTQSDDTRVSPSRMAPGTQEEAARIHAENLKYTPTIPQNTILCHIVTDSILPIKQRIVLQDLEKDMAGSEYSEKIVQLKIKDSSNFVDELKGVIARKTKEYEGYNVQFDVACPSTDHVNAILDSGLGIKALAFKPCKETEIGVMEVEDIILALRALYLDIKADKLEALREAFKFITGKDLSQEESDEIKTIDDFIRSITFTLPITRVDYNDIQSQNTIRKENIETAA